MADSRYPRDGRLSREQIMMLPSWTLIPANKQMGQTSESNPDLKINTPTKLSSDSRNNDDQPGVNLRFEITSTLAPENLLPDLVHSSSERDINHFTSDTVKGLQFTQAPAQLHQTTVSHEPSIEDLDAAIGLGIESLGLFRRHDPSKPELLEHIGMLYWFRYRLSDELVDVRKSEYHLEQALLLAEEGYSNAGQVLNMLGNIYTIIFKLLHDVDDLKKSISYLQQATLHFSDDDTFKAGVLSNLGTAHSMLFENLGGLDDLNSAIACGENAICLYNHDDPEKPSMLWNLGNAYWDHFETFSELEYANMAVACKAESMSLMDNTATKPLFLGSLSRTYHGLFERYGGLEHLDNSICFLEQALALIPDDFSQKPELLCDLGSLLEFRSTHIGSVQADDKAIICLEQAVQLTATNHSSWPLLTNRLGNAYLSYFLRLGEPKYIDKAIGCLSEASQLTPNEHPRQAEILHSLGTSYLALFRQLGGPEIIDKAISNCEAAVSLTPDHHPMKVKFLGTLGDSYRSRFEHLNQLEDIDRAIFHQNQAILLTSEADPIQAELLNLLGCAFHTRFGCLGKLEDLRDAIGYFERAVEIAPDRSKDKLQCLANLANTYHSLFRHVGGFEHIQTAVSYQERVMELTPLGRPGRSLILNNLGIFYQALFEQSGKLEDIDKAIVYGTQAEQSMSDSHPSKPEWLNNLGNAYWYLYRRLGNLMDIEKSIQCLEQANRLTFDYHPEKPRQLECLGSSYLSRFTRISQLEDLNRGIECHEQAVLFTPDNHLYKPRRLNALGSAYMRRFWYLKVIEDLHKSVTCEDKAITITPDNHPEKPGMLSSLGITYYRLFQSSYADMDLKKSLEYQQIALKIAPEDYSYKPEILANLGRTFIFEYCRSKDPQCASQAMLYFKQVALISTCNPITRLEASEFWALLSPQSLEAYTQAMAILPQLVWLGDSIVRRHEHLSQNVQELVTKAVAAAISLEDYNRALEWLEQGRSIVWNQTLRLRTPFDELQVLDPILAQELREVSSELDRSSLSTLEDSFLDSSSGLSHETAQRRRRLAEAWERLLSQTRLIPGFEDFLLPPRAEKIISHIQDRIVVVVNVHHLRCDALIIRGDQNGLCIHTTLADFSYKKAEHARQQLASLLHNESLRGVFQDKSRLGRNSLKPILAMLWYDVAKPVLDCLGFNQLMPIDNLPHITWCTTGPLSFLPLHAAGDYNQQSAILFNLAVSSYTPTLSSLINPSETSSIFSGLLAVAQTSTHGLSPLPGASLELDQIAVHARNLRLTRLEDNMACADTVLNGMGDHSWVHFACHASQNALDPMRSAFHLHETVLDLGTIVKQPLKNAQLAFLSACQTATGDKMLPEEAAHLAAGLMMAGYGTVIATMWSISDQHAPLVASKFYEYILGGGKPDVRRAAKALHKAVGHLREEIGVDNFGGWVPYIHMGS